MIREVGEQTRRDCIAEISTELGIPYDDAGKSYDVMLSSHQTHVVQGKGKKFEDVIRDWVDADILPLIHGSVYVRQSNSRESRGRSGRNPIDGVIISPRHVLGVSIKWSGKAGGLQQVLSHEMTDLTSRYRGYKVRLALVAGPSMPLTDTLLGIDWLMPVRPDDTFSRQAFIREIRYWTAG